ncbi:hypothetical protein AMJ99_CH03124 [Rhizobium esperanzae]|nr:hypothetical protein AMJ99_CH03124 [Rhizobium esperanzae]ANM35491.1 hypothetical protein AMK04_CH03128 [Rhizobium sp. N871]
MHRKACDLTAGAFRLIGPQYQPLINAIKRAQAAESVSLDLHSVQDSLDALIERGKELKAEMEDIVAPALLTHAIVLYVRASSSSSERFKVGFEGAFSPEQRDAHNAIVRLRDKCVAHFGEDNGNWNSEKLLYIENGESNSLNFVHKRTHVDFYVVMIMKNLLETAIPSVIDRRARAIDKVDEEIQKLSAADASQLLSVPFEESSFFKSKGLGDRFWDSDSYSSTVKVRI